MSVYVIDGFSGGAGGGEGCTPPKIFCIPSEPVLPQPLVQKSFSNLQNSFFPTKFPCHPNGGKNQENSGNLRQMCHGPYEKSSIITLPEILGKLSRVPSMKVSGPHIFLCSSRGVGCLIIVEGSDGRRC